MLVHVSFDEVVGEGIWEGVVSREGGEDDVPELDAVRRDGFDEGVVVFGEELGEVMEEDEEDPHRSLEEDSRRFLHLGCREEGGEELEEGDEEGVVLGPVLKRRRKKKRSARRRDEGTKRRRKTHPLLLGSSEELRHEEMVRNEGHPREGESGKERWLKHAQGVAAGTRQAGLSTNERRRRANERVETKEEINSPESPQATQVSGRNARLDVVKIVEDAREEPEEGPLVEVVTELLVGLNEDEDDDGEDLVEVSNLGLVGFGSVGVSVVLEEEDEEL